MAKSEQDPRSTRFPEEMEAAVNKIKERHKSTFSAAVVYLVELGLEADAQAEKDKALGRQLREAKEKRRSVG